MSIPVDVATLATALADFGPGYLLTAGANGHITAVTVEPSVVDGVLVVGGAGRGSSANIAANPAVTLLFRLPSPAGSRCSSTATPSWTGRSPRHPHQRRDSPPRRTRGRPARSGRLRPRLQTSRLTCHFWLLRLLRPVTSCC